MTKHAMRIILTYALALLGWGSSPTSADIIINEVMKQPLNNQNNARQWVELYNTGDVSVNLTDWFLATAPATTRLTGDIAAGGYLVIGQSNVRTFNGNVTVNVNQTIGGEFELYEVTGDISLYDKSSNIIDRVNYDSTFPNDSGASMAFSQKGTENDYSANWCNSAKPWIGGTTAMKGTPGAANDCPVTNPVPRVVVINEIMKDPAGDDNKQEWIELRNTGNAIVNLTGWDVLLLNCYFSACPRNFRVTLSGAIPANGFYLIGRNNNTAVNGNVTLNFVTSDPRFSLVEDRGEIHLRSEWGAVVDKVKYDETFPNTPGSSMTFSQGQTDTTLATNWCNSPLPWSGGTTSMTGTPGATNECPSPPPMRSPTKVPANFPSNTSTKAPAAPFSSTTKAPTIRSSKVPTKPPMKSDVTKSPTSTTGPTKCGLLQLSLFCPSTKCGLFGRLLNMCKE